MGKNKNGKAKSSAKKELCEQQKQKKKRMRVIKDIVSMVLIAGVAVGLFVALLWGAGVFDYHPEATYDVLISIENYGSVHVELYGNDAPETVKHFLSLVNSGYYNGKSVYKLFDDLAYMGTDVTDKADIKGEFAENGHKNDLQHIEGVISMARTNDPNSATSQFFICNADARASLDGKYAAFGYVVEGLSVVHKITALGMPKTDYYEYYESNPQIWQYYGNGAISNKADQPVIEYVKILEDYK